MTSKKKKRLVSSESEDDPPPSEVPSDYNKKGKYASKEDKEAADPFSCVNIKLNSIWNPTFVKLGPVFESFSKVLDDVVWNWNKVVLEASCFMNMHVLRLLRESSPLPKLDQAFIEACCRIVTEGSRERKEEDLKVTFEQFKMLRPEVDYQPPQNEGFSRFINNIRRRMEVNIKNHIICNFVVRLIRFLRSKYGLKRKGAYDMLYGTFDKKNKQPSEDQVWLKSWLVYNPLSEWNLKMNLDHFFRLTYDLLLYQESLDPMTKGRKTFSLLPTSSSYIMSHVDVDRCDLVDLLQQLPKDQRRTLALQFKKGCEIVQTALSKKTKKGKYFVFNFNQDMFKNREFSEEVWRFLFNVKPLETCNRRFAFGLSTNGYDVSLRFTVNKKRMSSHTEEAFANHNRYSPEDFDRFVGVDPGRTFIATGYASTWESEVNEKVQFSLKEYRHLAKMNESRDWEKRLRKRDNHYDTILNGLPTMKSTNIDESIRYRLGVGDWMFRFCRDKAFLKWRFKTKIYSRKALVEVVKRLVGTDKTKRTIVGLGDWSQQDGYLKGTPKAPIKRLKTELKKRAVVLDIDEYRTSKTCSKCCGLESMENVKVWKDVKDRQGVMKNKLVKCHQILRCRSIECRMCWQRDLNASRNIWDLLWCELTDSPRSQAMTRGLKLESNTSL